MGAHERYRAAAEEGLTAAETAKRYGVSRKTVYSVAQNHGFRFKRAYRFTPRKLPPLGPLLSQMDPKCMEWLVSETPEGATLADTIRAIITDAYFEAME